MRDTTGRCWIRTALLAGCLGLVGGLEVEADPQRQRRLGQRGQIPVEDDVKIGMATVQQIEADPKTYPVLDPAKYAKAYAYLSGILGRVLASPAIEYRDLFHYDQIKIIADDSVLNAFCTAGGFIYVYTGLIKYLETEDHLAGVLGHEIAHAEKRHVAAQLQKEHRRKLLKLGTLIAAPGGGEVAAVFAGLKLTELRYGRSQETESDEMSVIYLSTSDDYACDGAAGFFAKLGQEGQDGREPPKWLSSHPDGKSRIRHITDKARELGCSTELRDPDGYERFRQSLP